VYGVSQIGIRMATNEHHVWEDCIVVNCGAQGIQCNDGWTTLINYAHYNNTGGAILGTDYTAINTIVLTADPFVDAGAHNFGLNDVAGGGADCRGIAHAAASGLFTSYNDLGAAQHEDAGGGGRTIYAIG
jgi:hypothetical protein